MQVKVFLSQEDAPKLETEINMWLKNNNKIEISHVTQSYAFDGKHDSYALISIWYTVIVPDTHTPI
jgi:hypothetical protein